MQQWKHQHVSLSLLNKDTMISHNLDLTCTISVIRLGQHQSCYQALQVTGGIFEKTHRLDLYCNAMSLLCCSLSVNVLSRVLPLCHWCKCYAKLLESERHLSNGDFAFWAVYFPAQLDRAAAQKTERYLVSATENIDQKHVLLREDKHASFIPHCQFSLRQKALESTTTGKGALRWLHLNPHHW